MQTDRFARSLFARSVLAICLAASLADCVTDTNCARFDKDPEPDPGAGAGDGG